MVIGDMAKSAALDLAKNEGIQDKAGSLLGMLFPYAGIEKRALDMYLSEIEKSDLSPEAKLIAVLNAKGTIKKLKNQHRVAEVAIANSKEETVFDSSSGVSQEWLGRFMDSAGFVSEDQVQIMWGKVLAKEFDQPGTTPSNMIRILSEISPLLARAFQVICSMRRLLIIADERGNVTSYREDVVVPYYNEGEELRRLGLPFNVLNELDSLGLIKFNSSLGFVALQIPETGVLTYTNGNLKEIKKHQKGQVPIGSVMLTEAGECLKRITEPEIIDNYEKMEMEYMTKNGVEYKEDSAYSISADENGNLVLHNSNLDMTSDN